ncbi:RluA family pseudouridine synthase [Candidatus Azambacteria bacterium]|nr:RluA family pseudouridine synthase [Candidatus Azambacteria bacterium]
MFKKITVIYENNDLAVLDKPAGILVHQDKEGNNEKTIVDFILEKYPEIKDVGDSLRPGIVHRIDREVSGILIIAKNLKTLDLLQKQFKKGKIVKKYLALVEGKIFQKNGVIQTLVGKDREAPIRQLAVKEEFSHRLINPKQAITRYKVLEHFKNQEGRELTLVEVSPETGRTHQIRIHFVYIQHPLVGDKKYGSKIPLDGRIFLHASYLEVKLLSDTPYKFNSPLPTELQNFLDNLEKTA